MRKSCVVVLAVFPAEAGAWLGPWVASAHAPSCIGPSSLEVCWACGPFACICALSEASGFL